MLSSDSDILIAMLDHEFAFFAAQTDSKRSLVLLGRLLPWLQREPRLSVLLRQFVLDAEAAALRFQRQQQATHDELAQLWNQHGKVLKEVLDSETDKDQLSVFGSFDDFEVRCRTNADLVPCIDCDERDESRARRMLKAIMHWISWATGEGRPALPEDLQTEVNRIDEAQEYNYRRFQLAAASLPGVAWARLQRVLASTIPEPPDKADAGAVADYWINLDVSRAVYSAGEPLRRSADRVTAQLEDAAQQAQQDARLLHQELRQALLLGWSRQALVRRYAARCHAFDSERLRKAANAAARRAEAVLARDFAKYLFDAGLTPLLEADIGALRPDLVDLGGRTMLYVEAKQYSGKSPRAMLIKAYRQVWSTWGRIRAQHNCEEAFLVVFRRSGPRVELPPELHLAGLVLYSVLVDLSPRAGSSEKHTAMRIDPAELLPTDARR
jgi:hypothetical protein